MAAQRVVENLIDRLPEVRGTLVANAELAPLTWFRTGGRAEVLFRPSDSDDLTAFLGGLPSDIAITVVGVGSNLLVRDGGVEGVVIRIGKAFADIEVKDDRVIAGAGAPDIAVAHKARDAGLAGLEFLRGIPGTIGGAVAMNAGAYGREMADVLIEAEIVTRQGERRVMSAQEFDFTYRHARFPQDAIILRAVLQARQGDKAAITAEMQRIADEREDSQPLRTRTGGSTFKNPPGQSAWRLIDAAGGRGLRIGGAQVSEKHCNFLINTGEARAADIEALGEKLRSLVKAQSGIELEWEIRRIGKRGGGA